MSKHCLTCNGWAIVNGVFIRRRETVGMKCASCGKDYAKPEEVEEGDFERTSIVKVVGPNGKLRLESESEVEARQKRRPGDKLYRLHKRTEYKWIEEEW